MSSIMHFIEGYMTGDAWEETYLKVRYWLAYLVAIIVTAMDISRNTIKVNIFRISF